MLALLCIMSLLSAKCQIDNGKLLQALLTDSTFSNVVMSCRYCDTLYVIDTLNYFSKGSFMEGKVVITSSYIQKRPVPMNSTELKKWNCNNLFIAHISKDKREFQINYSHSATRGSGFVRFRLKNGVLKKVGEEFGQD